LRPAATQDQAQVLAMWFGFGNWILCYDTAVVFDIYIQVRTRNDASSKLQDFREAVRSKPMIGVTADMRLQHDLFFFSGLSATIDEVSDYVPNFRDVGVCRDVIAVGENESR
jgi:hypothetical protein